MNQLSITMHGPRLLATWLTLAVAACVPVNPANNPAPSAFLATIDRELSRHEAVPWSASRRLTWDDFRGVPPVSEPDRAAETAYSLFHAAGCRGKTFEFRVVAAVLPRQSWVRPAILANPTQNSRTLRHEQTHFDLSEVHARRMRRYFSELRDPCLKSEPELEAQGDRFIRDEAAAQRRYDEETSHGRIAQRQAAWDADIARQIASLDRYVK
jgi:hypothetical protein